MRETQSWKRDQPWGVQRGPWEGRPLEHLDLVVRPAPQPACFDQGRRTAASAGDPLFPAGRGATVGSATNGRLGRTPEPRRSAPDFPYTETIRATTSTTHLARFGFSGMKDLTAVGVNLEATVQGMAVVESWSRSYQPQFEVEPDQKQIPSNQQSQPKCLQGWGSMFHC